MPSERCTSVFIHPAAEVEKFIASVSPENRKGLVTTSPPPWVTLSETNPSILIVYRLNIHGSFLSTISVTKKEISVDSITDFIFGIICSEKEKSSTLNFVLKEKTGFENFRVFVEECHDINLSSLISRQLLKQKK